MTTPIARLEEVVRATFPNGVGTSIDGPPLYADGVWWLDIVAGPHDLHVEWSPTRGFGVHVAESDHCGYGEKPDEIHADFDSAWASLRGHIEKAIAQQGT